MSARKQKFDTLVHAYSADLYRYAFWLCHRKDVAEELVQETFLRAWKGIDALQDMNSVKSWLMTILRRENARRFSRKQLDMAEYDEAAIVDPQTGRDTETIQACIQSLDEIYREPLILQVIGGYSCEEIAAITGVSKGAVMTRLFRARQQLRKILVRHGYSNDVIRVEGT